MYQHEGKFRKGDEKIHQSLQRLKNQIEIFRRWTCKIIKYSFGNRSRKIQVFFS